MSEVWLERVILAPSRVSSVPERRSPKGYLFYRKRKTAQFAVRNEAECLPLTSLENQGFSQLGSQCKPKSVRTQDQEEWGRHWECEERQSDDGEELR